MKQEIREFIFKNYLIGGEEKDLNDKDSFLEKGIIDSTGILELVMFIEENYNIEVEDEEVIPDNLDSVQKVCDYIEKKVHQGTFW